MKILVINTGSSSVKFGVFDGGNAVFETTLRGQDGKIETLLASVPQTLSAAGFTSFDAIGHRIAHGGTAFSESCLIDDSVVADIETCAPLAPLHNPPNLEGIRMARKMWPGHPHVAVFDTAFHRTMPETATYYAVPMEWRAKGVRRYGFHGTSHRYIMQRVAAELDTTPQKLRIISCHLGSGASLCAIAHGISVDTSMGMTALGGLVMGTRCGDTDPGLSGFLQRNLDLSADEVEAQLYRRSGLMALAGTGDMKEIETRAAGGEKSAMLAIDVFARHVRHYMGAYAAAMNGVDVIAFTGGIGENAALVRHKCCEKMDFMKVKIDPAKNATIRLTAFEAPQIGQDDAAVKIIVTKTREEWMIAQDVTHILTAGRA